MSEGSDDSQKTEEPTHKKLEEARKRGQIYNSREINSFLLLMTLTLIISWGASGMSRDLVSSLSQLIQSPDIIPMDSGSFREVIFKIMLDIGSLMAAPMLALVVAALFAGFVQKPLVLSLDPLTPKLEKISPLKGIKRMFSLRSITEFIKGIIKITVVGSIAFMTIWPERRQMMRMPDMEMDALLAFIHAMMIKMLIGVLVAMFFIAILDYLYQRYEYIKGLRMSKQEIKDEYKQQEGDPKIKQRLRQLRMERSRTRMMAAVPTADVVITNPTHYSVALQYDNMRMAAPRVIAKGKDKVAFKIRELAKENDIPIVENPPLARALFGVELEQEVPLEHYKAVAEVISYVYKLKGKKITPYRPQ